jgi:hypothetical protein
VPAGCAFQASTRRGCSNSPKDTDPKASITTVRACNSPVYGLGCLRQFLNVHSLSELCHCCLVPQSSTQGQATLAEHHHDSSWILTADSSYHQHQQQQSRLPAPQDQLLCSDPGRLAPTPSAHAAAEHNGQSTPWRQQPQRSMQPFPHEMRYCF